MTNRRMTRRGFLKATAVVGAPWVIRSSALGKDGAAAPSERIAMGVIGIGARGSNVMRCFLWDREVQVLAVCDVQAGRRRNAKGAVDGQYGHADCKAYRDLRELLAREDIDAVLIATGDRWHALASVLAAKAGKDVYCEKPMSLTIAEGRAVAETMRRHARVYQCGTQRRNDLRFAFAAQLAREGNLGRLHTVHAYTPSFVRNIGAFAARPAEPPPPREDVDWGLWLGPVAWRAYNCSFIGGLGGWSHVPDLGGGGITDWGTHQADLAAFANDAEATSPVEYEQSGRGEVAAKYANGVRLVFHEGLLPGTCLAIRFEGTDGWVFADDNRGLSADPPSLLGLYKAALLRGEQRPTHHVRQFLECVRTRRRPVCNAEVAHRATTACHAANLCLCLGRPLKWDPAKEAFIGDEDADRMRSRALREPWRL